MKFIHRGWGIIADKERIFFHDSGERGDKHDYYIFDGNLEKISEKEYFEKKYGEAYEKITAIYGNTMTDSIHDLNENIYVSFYQDWSFKKFDPHGNLIREYQVNFDTVYDIEIQGQSIWLAYPTANTIKRYTIDTFTEELSLGDRSDEFMFSIPKSIVIYENYLYVCDMGNNRIRKVDLTDLSIEDKIS